jgi:CHAT domain-containing protein
LSSAIRPAIFQTEARRVAEILGVPPVLGPMATVALVRDALPRAPIIHLAAHAQFDGTDPMKSVIRLADGTLTARELIGAYCEAKLVVLSACEGASAGRGIGGEVVGLANALLRAGAGAVLAPLWRADDKATAFLMTLFYEGRVWGLDDAAALAEAMKATGDHPSWRHPSFWSGFVLLSAR